LSGVTSTTDSKITALNLTYSLPNSTTAGLWTHVIVWRAADVTNYCGSWEDIYSYHPIFLNGVFESCPCNIFQAELPNSGFEQNSSPGRRLLDKFLHHGSSVCYLQSSTVILANSAISFGKQECCYDINGSLIIGAPNGGRQLRHVEYSNAQSSSSWLDFFNNDISPYIGCCIMSTEYCNQTFYTRKPSNDCHGNTAEITTNNTRNESYTNNGTTNGGDCSNSSNITAEIIQHPLSVNVSVNSTVIFTCEGLGNTIFFTVDGELVSNITNKRFIQGNEVTINGTISRSLTGIAYKMNNNTNITCTIFSVCPESFDKSQVATLFIHDTPPRDVFITPIYYASKITLTCSAYDAADYQWIDMSTGQIVSNNSIIYISTMSNNMSGQYQCIAKNEAGSNSAFIKGEL
jgi:hypothetical protein